LNGPASPNTLRDMHTWTASLLLAALGASPAQHPRNAAVKQHPAALSFIEDNYAKALSSAKSRHLPIFVEAWAPW